MNAIDLKLQELGLELPQVAPPAANYIPYTIHGSTLYIAGQITSWNGELKFLGKVGKDFSIEQGQEAAKLCALNILAQARAALGGDLTRIERCLKLGGFVNCGADFTDQPKVINGASDIMVAVLGEAGKHARFAVGAPSLPLGVAVEIDAIFAIRP